MMTEPLALAPSASLAPLAMFNTPTVAAERLKFTSAASRVGEAPINDPSMVPERRNHQDSQIRLEAGNDLQMGGRVLSR